MNIYLHILNQVLHGHKRGKSTYSTGIPQSYQCTRLQLVSCSRQTFAFARDGALPFSSVLYRINPYTRTPVNCVWASVFAGFLLGLLAFAGPTAINAIFSLGVIGQYLAFSIPIACRFLGGVPWRAGPFNFGRLVRPLSLRPM